MEKSVHIFLSEDEHTAFQQALNIVYQGEESHTQGWRKVETRRAEVVRLDYLCSNRAQFEVRLGSSKARERLLFDHASTRRSIGPNRPF